MEVVANEILKMVQSARSKALPETVHSQVPVDMKGRDLSSLGVDMTITQHEEDSLMQSLQDLRDKNAREIARLRDTILDKERQKARDIANKDHEIVQLKRLLEESRNQSVSIQAALINESNTL